jgi:hypothetical protein
VSVNFPVGVVRVFDAGDNARLEWVPFLNQFVDALRIRALGARQSLQVARFVTRGSLHRFGAAE